MKNIKLLNQQLNVMPKLRLGIKKVGGGVEPTGPHHVKFLEEPTTIMGKDDAGKPRKELKFVVEENGNKYRWMVPILSKEGQPSYLLERLEEIEVGDERILEMVKARGRNYIDIRKTDEETELPDDDAEEAEAVEDETR